MTGELCKFSEMTPFCLPKGGTAQPADLDLFDHHFPVDSESTSRHQELGLGTTSRKASAAAYNSLFLVGLGWLSRLGTGNDLDQTG